MKRSLFFFALLFFVFSPEASCQIESENIKHGLSFNIGGGSYAYSNDAFLFSYCYDECNLVSQNFSMRASINASYHYMFSEKSSLAIGLGSTKLKAQEWVEVRYESEFYLDYYQVSVTILDLQVGYRQNIARHFFIQPTIYVESRLNNYTDFYNTGLSAAVRAGIYIPMSKYINLTISGVYKQAVTDYGGLNTFYPVYYGGEIGFFQKL